MSLISAVGVYSLPEPEKTCMLPAGEATANTEPLGDQDRPLTAPERVTEQQKKIVSTDNTYSMT